MSTNAADRLYDAIMDFLEYDMPVTLSVERQEKLGEYVGELYDLAEPEAERQRLNERYGVGL